MAGQIDKDKEIDLLRLELAAMTRDRDYYRAQVAPTGITQAELEFLQAKAEGTLPANASWADWKASWTERKA